MLVYIIVDCFVIFCGILCGGHKCFEYSKVNNRSFNSKIFYLAVSILLVIISGFRGDFAVDYNNYVDLFYRYENWSFLQILSKNFMGYPETGYLVYQFLIKLIYNNPILLFVVTSIIIVKLNIDVIEEYFPYGILPVLLFIELGNYYSSFNVMRQILAASILLIGSSYLYDKKFLKYSIVVLIAFTIHKSALIMLPFYFILNIKLKKQGIVWFTIASILLSVFLPQIISFVQIFYWGWYNSEVYGMKGYSINNLVAPAFITVFPLMCEHIFKKEKINRTDNYEQSSRAVNIWRNSSLVFLMFSILGMQVEMVQRVSTFFSTYAIMYFSYIISSRKMGKYGQVIYAVIVILIMVYGFMVKVNSAHNPYYFIFA